MKIDGGGCRRCGEVFGEINVGDMKVSGRLGKYGRRGRRGRREVGRTMEKWPDGRLVEMGSKKQRECGT